MNEYTSTDSIGSTCSTANNVDSRKDNPRHVERDAVLLANDRFLRQILEDLTKTGEARIDGCAWMGGNIFYKGILADKTIRLPKVTFQHKAPPRPDQTAFYDVTVWLRPTNSERKVLIKKIKLHCSNCL